MLGLRRSEICALHWDDIDFTRRALRVNKSVQRVDGQLQEMPTKTRRSNRTIPLPNRCLYALADHHRRLQEVHGEGPGRPWQPTGYLFGTRWGTPLEPRNLTRMFGRALRPARHPPRPAARTAPHLRIAATRARHPPTCGHGDRRPQRHRDDHERLRTRQPRHPTCSPRPARRRAVRLSPLLSRLPATAKAGPPGVGRNPPDLLIRPSGRQDLNLRPLDPQAGPRMRVTCANRETAGDGGADPAYWTQLNAGQRISLLQICSTTFGQ